MMSRDAVLGRIRAGLDGVADDVQTGYSGLARRYTQTGSMDTGERLALMVERLREYDAEVVECTASMLDEAVAQQIASSGKRVLAAPAGLPRSWLAKGLDWRIDHDLSHDEIEIAEGVVTASFYGIAESGTIVLHHSPAEGRRVLTLLPDWHLCVLLASQVVETLPEYFARCVEPPRLATYISGPSATADIEMTRIKGVHGPRFLSVILVRDE
jgi:L-lactate dehydrogenase complex protein LldG